MTNLQKSPFFHPITLPSPDKLLTPASKFRLEFRPRWHVLPDSHFSQHCVFPHYVHYCHHVHLYLHVKPALPSTCSNPFSCGLVFHSKNRPHLLATLRPSVQALCSWNYCTTTPNCNRFAVCSYCYYCNFTCCRVGFVYYYDTTVTNTIVCQP